MVDRAVTVKRTVIGSNVTRAITLTRTVIGSNVDWAVTVKRTVIGSNLERAAPSFKLKILHQNKQETNRIYWTDIFLQHFFKQYFTDFLDIIYRCDHESKR